MHGQCPGLRVKWFFSDKGILLNEHMYWRFNGLQFVEELYQICKYFSLKGNFYKQSCT